MMTVYRGIVTFGVLMKSNQCKKIKNPVDIAYYSCACVADMQSICSEYKNGFRDNPKRK
jgi:hypothetical protein